MNKQKIVGLIGYPLSHSFSRKYFTDKFRKEGISGFEYRNFEIEDVGKIKEVISSNPGLIGLNVTIPYKESIIPYLDELSPEAEEIGAVNTICIHNSGLSGHNTDHIGFSRTMDLILDKKPSGALILGTGGASKAVEFSLKERGIPYRYVSRKPAGNALSYKDINKDTISRYPLVINTTPLGMYPEINSKPEIPYDLLGAGNYLIDLVYNPDKTLFLEEGEKAGASTINGLPMLVSQAEASWDLWVKK